MSFRKILAATDLSPAGNLGVEHAAQLARRCGAELVLLHAAHIPEALSALPAGSAEDTEVIESAVRKRFARARDELQELLRRCESSGVRASKVFIDEFADQGIPRAATELGADLVVIGAHGQTGLSRLLLGSTAERIVRQCPTSILVVRDIQPSPDGYRKILVPTDLSDATTECVRVARDLVSPEGEIELFHAWELPAAGALEEAWGAGWSEFRRRIVGDNEQRGHELLPSPASSVFFAQHEGPTVASITQDAASHYHDLIIMNSHGRRGLRRFVMGSVTEAVIRHAPSSVLVLHSRQRETR